MSDFIMTANGSGIAEGGVYLHNSPSEAQKFNVVQLLISGTSAPHFWQYLVSGWRFKIIKMKTTLLRKIRREGRNQIEIYSITKRGGLNIGMSIGYNSDEYSGLFEFGDTKEEVYKKAENIYIETHLPYFRNKYKKFTRKGKI